MSYHPRGAKPHRPWRHSYSVGWSSPDPSGDRRPRRTADDETSHSASSASGLPYKARHEHQEATDNESTLTRSSNRDTSGGDWQGLRKDKLKRATEDEVLYTLMCGHGRSEPKKRVLNIIGLQRFILHHIQSHIARLAAETSQEIEEHERARLLREIRLTIYDYCDTVRDLEHMQRWNEKTVSETYETNPFIPTSSRELERILLKSNGLMTGSFPKAVDAESPRLPGTARSFTDPEDLRWYAQAALAFLALIPIIGPAFAIIYAPWAGINWFAPGLVLLLVAVIVIGLRRLRTRDVLTIIIGYASIYVVFVGLNAEPVVR